MLNETLGAAPEPAPTPSGRARPLPLEERRAAIAAATVPLLIAHGQNVTTKQIAEASGVAEGTLFRCFADKAELIDAAIAAYLDPESFCESLRTIDPRLSFELKLTVVLDRMNERFAGMFGIFASMGVQPKPQAPPNVDVINAIFAHLFERDEHLMRITVPQLAAYLGGISMASAIPHLGGPTLSAPELATMVARGVLTEPAGRLTPATQ